MPFPIILAGYLRKDCGFEGLVCGIIVEIIGVLAARIHLFKIQIIANDSATGAVDHIICSLVRLHENRKGIGFKLRKVKLRMNIFASIFFNFNFQPDS